MTDKLSTFFDSGIYRFENSNAVFIDPVRAMNRSYTRFRVTPSAYYPRFFDSKPACQESKVSSNSRKRKRKEKKPHALNEREKIADQRHQVFTKRHRFFNFREKIVGNLSNLSHFPRKAFPGKLFFYFFLCLGTVLKMSWKTVSSVWYAQKISNIYCIFQNMREQL